MVNLSGKAALVTGASRGIGRAIAERLASDGARVAVHFGSNDAAADETVAAIEKAGGSAFAVRALLGVPGDVDALFAGLGTELDGQPLDVLVNNASCGNQETVFAGSIERLTPAQFDEVFAINVKAPFFIIQRALALLRDGGRIVNISSTAARVAVSHQIAYAMSKATLELMSRTLANSLGLRGITVNSVAPGATGSNLTAALADPAVRAGVSAVTALGRIGQPADIADVVAFLASDDARWVTGNHIDASGGLFLGPIERSA